MPTTDAVAMAQAEQAAGNGEASGGNLMPVTGGTMTGEGTPPPTTTQEETGDQTAIMDQELGGAPAEQQSRWPLYVGVGAGVLLLGVIGYSLLR